MKKIVVIGHANPDTDSIVAPIALSKLLKARGLPAQSYKKGNLNKESQWALKNANQENEIKEISEAEINPQEVGTFLVDFNEASQCPIDPQKIKLFGLIDHHKLGSTWKTEEPILFRIEPVGSTSTLVAKMYKENGIEISKEIAKLLLCGIISDTLNLNSPTTTDEDKVWANILSEIANEDIQKLANNLFEAKSDLSSFSPKEIAKLDYKVFEMGEKKVGIGVLETVKPENANKIEEKLKEEITKIKSEDGLDYVFWGIVDIIKNETEMLIIGEEERALIMKSFSDLVIKGDNLVLRKVVSRKKQIVPSIEKGIKLT